MKRICVGCGKEIGDLEPHGYLHYWDNKDGERKQGHWHPDCFHNYKFSTEIPFWRTRKWLGLL